nr:semaphorin-4A isoform X1 [Misgurnus anguillicaudatus]
MVGSFRMWILTLCFLGLVDLFEAALRPRLSFPRGSLERSLGIYDSSTVKNYTTLLLSTDANTLFVGAQDAVLSLDVSQPDNITLKDKLQWASSEDNLKKCHMASKTDCRNFVRVLQFFNSTHLYACGTNAYGPQSIIIPAGSLSTMKDTKDAKNCCPYSSTQRNTATIVDEELYTATSVGYFGKDHVISRCLSTGTRNNLVLDSEPKLLNDPVFIHSTHIASERKILLFFTEVGDLTGDLFANSFTVSRVAQICTDDNGGHRVLQKRWTSFAKSQLVCQQGDGLQFNILQDIVTLLDDDYPDNTLFYGVFTPQWSLSSGRSAVCAFSLADIKAAFSGHYKTYDMNGNKWSPHSNTDGKLGKCGLFNDSDSVLNTVKKTFLTKQAVRPMGKKLLLSSPEELYSRLVAQKTQAANGRSYTILYLLTESGFLHKIVLLTKGPHIIEEIQVFKQPQTVKNIILSTKKGVLFIGCSEGVFRVPVSRCSVYPNCAECVLARDPFCGWDSETKVCTTVSSTRSKLRQDIESGNVQEQCAELKTTGPATAPRTAQFNEIVVLHCESRSRLAEVTWRFLNNSVVSQLPYVHQADGSLTFRVTPDTVGIYRCVSEELGFRQIIASFSVMPPITPRSFSHPSYQHPDVTRDSSKDTEMEPISEEETESTKGKTNLMNPENMVCIKQKSYYTEMIAFCILFVMCICLFTGFVVFWWHSMWCNKTVPQNACKDLETDSIWQTELVEKQSPNS